MALPGHVSGTDICMACQSSLADVLLTRCNHRVLCTDCLRKLKINAGQRGRQPMCPTCRTEIAQNQEAATRYLQLEETRVQDADPVDNAYPYGALLTFRREDDMEDVDMQFADTQTMARVREAVRACSGGGLSLEDLNAALNSQLSRDERELAFLELNKDVDLHATLVKLDDALLRRDRVWSDIARYMIKRTVEGEDTGAMAARAAVSAVADVVELGAIGMNSVKGANLVSNLVVCIIMSSVDVYRWSRGEITGNNLGCNVGEHVTGCGFAAGGAVGGATLGAAVGGPIAPVTAFLGALIGGFLADFIARKCYRESIKLAYGHETETEDQARERALTEAAATLGINLQCDGFALAKSKFRRMILENHPDRNSGQHSETAARIIAAWQIVRGHYELQNQLDDGDGSKEPEAHIVLMVMKCRQTAQDAWKVARTWFGEMDNPPVHHGLLEMVEQYTVYM